MLMMLTWWPAMTLRLAECVSFLGVWEELRKCARPSFWPPLVPPTPTPTCSDNTALVNCALVANTLNTTYSDKSCAQQNTTYHQHQPTPRNLVYNRTQLTTNTNLLRQHFSCRMCTKNNSSAQHKTTTHQHQHQHQPALTTLLLSNVQ